MSAFFFSVNDRRRSCFPFIRSGQNHLARHSERGKKTRWTKEEVGRQHQGMDEPRVRQVPEGSGEQGKTEKTGCKIICGAPTTLAVKGLMMMMMIVFYRSGSLGYSHCSFLSAASGMNVLAGKREFWKNQAEKSRSRFFFSLCWFMMCIRILFRAF